MIQVIDAIPLTTVGKIYKPGLRCEAARLKITDVVCIEFSLPNANIDVVAGGTRGMRLPVTLAPDDLSSVPAIEQALAAYLFETTVQVA